MVLFQVQRLAIKVEKLGIQNEGPHQGVSKEKKD